MRDGATDVRIVLDASVTLCWCFQDERSLMANFVLEQLRSGIDAFVPAIWWFEIHNAAMLAARKGRVTEADVSIFLQRLDDVRIAIAELPDATAIMTLAHRHRLTFYDAAYLELARRERLPLATLDQALAKAAADEDIALLTA